MNRIAALSNTDIARHAARGRQLQARAVRSGLASFGRLVFATVSAVVARRAFARRAVVPRAAVGAGCGAHA